MPKKEINKKTVISLFNKSFDQKEQLDGQVYLTTDKREFNQAIIKQKEDSQEEFKYDHIFYLHQLQNGTWGVVNVNQKPSYGDYLFSISNQERDKKEVNDFLSSLGVKCNSYNVNLLDIESTGDINKESAISSIEILENYLSLLKNKGDYGWSWTDLNVTPERQQELGQKYDRIKRGIKQQIEQDKFVKDFQKASGDEGIDINRLNELNLTEEEIRDYWRDGYNGKQAWEVSKVREKESEKIIVNLRKKLENEVQDWFDKKYPEEKRSKETEISIDGEGLKGELKIEGFDKLETINCFKNKLTNLKIINCPNVKNLNVSCNSLDNFDFLEGLKKNAKKLIHLSVHTNNLPKSDLSVFEDFTNLEELYLDNYDQEKISEDIYNRFHGSLEPLKNLTNLRLLNISGTDISEGLEDLPLSLRKIGCDCFCKLKKSAGSENQNYRCSKAKEKLEKGDEGAKDLKDYRCSKCSEIRQELENAARSEGTGEVLKKTEEGDTKWSKNWPRVAPWQKKHNLEKYKGRLEARESLKKEIKNLEEKEDGSELERKKAKVKNLDREIEELRKEIAGENLIAEHQNIQEEIERKKQELKELRKFSTDKSSGLVLSAFTWFSDNKSESEERSKNKAKKIEEEILKLEQKKTIIENDLESSNVVTKAPLTPNWLLNNEGKKLNENEDVENPCYEKMYPNPEDPFLLNDWQQRKSFLERKLPTKLFNVREFWEDNEGKIKEGDFKKIDWNKYVYKKDKNNNGDYVCMKDEGKKDSIKDYAILSYVWGDMKGSKEKLASNWSKKSLLKAVKALEVINKEKHRAKEKLEKAKKRGEKSVEEKFLSFFAKIEEKFKGSELDKDIDYLWMDQLCIDQDNPIEKAQEVRQMRQYYSDASVTLVAIHTTLGGNKIKFSESEEIIEGSDKKKRVVSRSLDLEKILKIIVKSEWFSRSWTYQEGWLGKNTIFMFDNILIDGRDLAAHWVLNQPSFTDYAKYDSLEELSKNIKKIATPLGWVRYNGEYSAFDKVTLRLHEALRAIKNKGRAVPIDGIYSILGLLPYGEHVEPSYEKKGEEYTSKELQKALFDVMQVAWENGYGEIFAWHGSGDNWIPNVDPKGKSSIEGGISIDISDLNNLTISKHKVNKVYNDITKIEGRGYIIDSGACTKDIEIGDKKVTLLGTREILENVRNDDVLLIPVKENDNNKWNSNKPFAIVVKKDNNRRLGLVEIECEGLENLQQDAEKLMVKEVNDIDKNNELEFAELFKDDKDENCQSQIEILPK